MVQDDVLKLERDRRDRVAIRRQKAILFSKSEDISHLEKLCRTVAGTLCDTSWNKLFVADPDMVLASKLAANPDFPPSFRLMKSQKKSAKQRLPILQRMRDHRDSNRYCWQSVAVDAETETQNLYSQMLYRAHLQCTLPKKRNVKNLPNRKKQTLRRQRMATCQNLQNAEDTLEH